MIQDLISDCYCCCCCCCYCYCYCYYYYYYCYDGYYYYDGYYDYDYYYYYDDVALMRWCQSTQVNLRRARLAPRWVTMSRFNLRCQTFILVCNQPPEANSAFHLSGVGK